VQDEREAYWLAPKTAPPLTTADVRAWVSSAHEPLQLAHRELTYPLAYAELNILNHRPLHLWLGHLIVDPAWRGQGLGQAFTRQLLDRAFACHAARAVSLVVFPENLPAIRCYRAAGLRDGGYEWHNLPPYARDVRLLRMTAER
jgi:RimJ/RimL family protein N-acetyltransferase